MKKIIKSLKLIIFIIVFIFIYNVNGNTVHAEPTGIYYDIRTNADEVKAGEYISVTFSIHNLELIPEEEDGICIFQMTLYYDSSKFEVPTGNNDGERAIVLDSIKEMGPQGTIDKVPINDIVCKVLLAENMKNYMEIDFQYELVSQKTFKTDGDLFTLKFLAKEDANGEALFYLNKDTEVGFSHIRTQTSFTEYEVDYSIAQKTVTVNPSTEASINKIEVKDIDSEINYLASFKDGKYYVLVADTTNNIEIIVSPKSSYATISGDGIKSLEDSYGEFIIEVTAPDGITINTYQLVVRAMKNINTLQEIRLHNGNLINGNNYLSIDSENDNYELNIKYTTTLNLEPVVTTGSEAKVYYEGVLTKIISLSNIEENVPKNIKIVVEAENGVQREYQFTIIMALGNSDTSLLLLETNPYKVPTIIDKTYSFNFLYTDENDISIIVQLNAATSSIKSSNKTITFTKSDGKYISNPIHLVPGILSSLILTVTSEKGNSTDYTINLFRSDLSKESKLKNISINDVPLVDFSPTKYKYSLGTFPNTVSSIKITATPMNEYSEINGVGDDVFLYLGMDVIIITVKSQTPLYGESQNETNYYLLVDRQEPLNDSCLISEILINGDNLSDFNEMINSYDIILQYETDRLFIEGNVSQDNPNASLSGNLGVNNLIVGLQTFTITCTSESGLKTNQYVLNVTRLGPSQDTSLQSIFIDNEEIFEENSQYKYEVPFSVDYINIEAVANDNKAIISGLGGKKLINVGENIIKIRVTAQDSNCWTDYEIIVIRNAPSSNNKLKSLKIIELSDIEFQNDQTIYSITVPFETLSITIVAEAEDELSRILPSNMSIYEFSYSLHTGSNRINIDVEAEDGSISKYLLLVNRNIKYNGDSSLKELQIEGYEPFKLKNEDEYIKSFNLIVPYNQTTIKVKAIAESDKSLIVGATTHSLSIGVNELLVTCIAENKTSTVYRILVIRDSLSSNNRLVNITIDELPNFVFHSDTEQYFITLNDDIEKLTIFVEQADQDAKINIMGHNNLKSGMNHIKIEVKAPDESIRVYSLFVNSPTKNTANTWMYFLISSNIASIGLAIVLIIKIMKPRRIKL